MRIIGGKHRGRKLSAPPGAVVRPTSERAREALFDILAHGRFADQPVYQDARILDAFAGTGAFGLEALSRGARFACFIEQNRAVREQLESNIAMLSETARTRIIAGDASRPPKSDGTYDLVFLDPPYKSDLAAPAIEALAQAGWVAPSALVVAELGARAHFIPPSGFDMREERRYGAARLVFLQAASRR